MTTSKQKPATRKVTVNLPEETISRIQAIANRHGLSMTEAIRRAIITESYIDEQIEEGSKVLIQKPDNTYREVVFR